MNSAPSAKWLLGEARKRLEALQTMPPAEACEQLIVRTLKRVEQAEASEKGRWRRLVRYGVLPVAASFLLLAGFHIYYLNLEPSDYDLKVVGQKELLAGAPAALRVQVVRRNRQGAGGRRAGHGGDGPREGSYPARQLYHG